MTCYRASSFLKGAVATIVVSWPFGAGAQVNPPLIEQSATGQPAISYGLTSAPATAPASAQASAQAQAPTPRPRSAEAVGDATRSLMALQADPHRAGQPHHVLGVTASRSWQRYLESFEHAVPEKYDAELEAGN